MGEASKPKLPRVYMVSMMDWLSLARIRCPQPSDSGCGGYPARGLGEMTVRRVLLSVITPCASAFAGTLLAISIALPSLAQADDSRIRADMWNLVGGDDHDRVRLTTGPAGASAVSVLGPDGAIRTQMAIGGQPSVVAGGDAGQLPVAAGFNLNAPGGTRIGRLGTAGGGRVYEGVNLYLNDAQGHVRIRLLVDETGAPSIEFYDADGNVTWAQR
jgi:hypothetical protein